MKDLLTELKDFWTLVRDVWDTGVGGADFGNIIIAITILGVALIVRGLFAKFVVSGLTRVAARNQSQIDDQIVDVLQAPLRFVPVIAGLFIAISYLDLDPRFADMGQAFVRTLIVFTLFWALYRGVGPLSHASEKLETLLSREMVVWLVNFLHVAIVLIGGAAVLEIWGIEVGPIVAGLGLFGVAVALGAQDLFKNLIAGILVIAEKRMKVGDWILVDGVVEGNVENIGFRSTVVRRFDKAPVYVPNAELSDNAVTNFTEMSHRRIKWIIGVEYGTTIEQLRDIRDGIEAYIFGNDDFAPSSDVSTFVRIDSFNDSSIDILVYCFTKTTKWGEWLKIKEQLAYQVKEIVEGAGTGFAFPSRSLYLEKIPSDAPEVFVPPQKKAS